VRGKVISSKTGLKPNGTEVWLSLNVQIPDFLGKTGDLSPLGGRVVMWVRLVTFAMINCRLYTITMLQNVYFQFETDFVASLRCIPMQVRYKLDTCGVKLKLKHWHLFSQEERQQLVMMPCDTEEAIATYRTYLQDLVIKYTGEPAGELPVDPYPAWMDCAVLPDAVQAKLQEVGSTLSPQQWAEFSPIQRFALLKLSRPGHENMNFVPALREFSDP